MLLVITGYSMISLRWDKSSVISLQMTVGLQLKELIGLLILKEGKYTFLMILEHEHTTLLSNNMYGIISTKFLN